LLLSSRSSVAINKTDEQRVHIYKYITIIIYIYYFSLSWFITSTWYTYIRIIHNLLLQLQINGYNIVVCFCLPVGFLCDIALGGGDGGYWIHNTKNWYIATVQYYTVPTAVIIIKYNRIYWITTYVPIVLLRTANLTTENALKFKLLLEIVKIVK